MRKNLCVMLIITASILFILSGCGSMKTMSLNSVELTGQLRPGMTYTEVESILGKPKSSRVEGENWIARWNLQEMWKGYIPYDMVFNSKDQTLVSWSENTKAYEAQQAQMKAVADEIDKQSVQTSTGGNNASEESPPSFESNQELMNYFKGKWYSFTSAGYGYTASSERRISLCANGAYSSSFESGYSGTNQDWGSASQGGGGGTWRISGNKTEGTIVTTSPGGKSTTYKYKTCGDGCLYIGSYKYAYEGAPECR
jgi:hypothetical protein